MKNLFVFILISFLLITPISAQETGLTEEEEEMLFEEDRPAEIENTRLLTVELIQNTQDPGSKEVEFVLQFTSSINTDRVRVNWDILGAINVEDGATLTQAFAGVVAGQTYSVPLKVIPTRQGVAEIEGIVRIVGVDSSAIATARKNFAINENREILPLTDEYRSARTLNTIQTYAIYIVVMVVLMGGGYFGYLKFKEWYKKD